jgi:hypothetical protein
MARREGTRWNGGLDDTGGRKMRSTSGRISLAIVLLATTGLVACSSPERDLAKAKKAGTIEALDAFLAEHPEGPLAQQARDAKEELVFDGIKAQNTIAAYEGFLKDYPDGHMAGAARDGIEALHFADAEAAGTIEAYDRFLRRHPRGKLVKKASKALDAMLPPMPMILSTVATSVDSYRCSVSSTVAILHRSGLMKADVPPRVEAGMMNCLGTVGPSGIETESFELQDPNHSILHVRSYSAAGWTECARGSCTVRFSVMGQETVVTANYQ